MRWTRWGAGHNESAGMTYFENLSDDELTERLLRRGVDASLAANLVRHREEPTAAGQIEQALERYHWPSGYSRG
jgi:hypothetical protein